MLEFLKNKRILILAAHPDDEVLGVGATANMLNSLDCKIELITFTDGVSSRDSHENNRNIKLEEVSKIIGIQKYTYGSFPDNALDSVSMLELSKFIENNVSGNYDVVFTHFEGDLNVDHKMVARATLTAFRPQAGTKAKIYSYYVPSATDYNPFSCFDGNSYIQVSQENVDAKIKALKVYGEEMRPPPHTRSYANVKSLLNVWGHQVGVEYAEKFKLIREII